MFELDIALSAALIASVIFLLFELKRFKILHSRKYEVPTEKIWEKFVGIRPEDLADSDLTLKIRHLDSRVKELEDKLEGQKKLTKKLVEELGK